MKFLSIDSPLMQGLGKLADLMLLNLLTLVFCLPLFTIGASMTALYYMTLKIVRDEEVYIVKGFLKSFKENFKQSTVVWLIQIVVMAILGLDYYFLYFMEENPFPLPIQVMLMVVTVIAITTFMFIYPVMSKFENGLKDTFKNAFLMGVMQLPKVVVMVVLWVAPIVLAIFAPQIFPLVVLFGMSLPAFASSFLYNKFFKKMEDRMIERAIEAGEIVPEAGEEDEHIFSDEVILADDSETDSKN